MTQSDSLDLRVRVVAFVDAGRSCRAAARHFGAATALPSSCYSARERSERHPGAAGPSTWAPMTFALRGLSDPSR